MYAAGRVVRRLFVDVAGSGRQLILEAVVFVAADNNRNYDVIFVQFRKMAHEKLTVSLVVDVAVMVEILFPPDVVVVCVTPALNVAV